MLDGWEAGRAADLPRWIHLHSAALSCAQGEPLHLDPSGPPPGTTRYQLSAVQELYRAVTWATIDDA